ncbi:MULTISPECIES: hypothetical protein [Streptococcus]|uniref:Uncharacterized protein n=1 Tax=Streptococcus ruminantium TaxID=1917441 RepID=A0ABU1B695_9STRE|nr:MULTISPECIES: hypothetical protein [Streptococcus]MDQ8759434.1 hypothetical protein [Streptococcus ruminantium]MDQ8764988.1 hypothetical protein [Streptococcus ruminantium]MDQ8769515.1 hypothetical protein [Streptococcus ruminantium]MDQ8775304.1 hypothetical protein [Streptococcus ruminantium]MDQ8793513.1 hypothetical protein [Streptococcus ruminantium]
MKKILKIVVGLVLFIGIALVGFGVFIDSRSIDGNWRTENIKNLLIANANEEDIAGIKELGIRPDQLIKTMDMSLEVNDGNASIKLSYQVDTELFKNSLVKVVDNTIESELQKQGLTYDALPDEAKQLIDKEKPSDSAIKQQIADTFTAAAKEIDGEYNTETGILTVPILKGVVDPVFNSIKTTSINEKANKLWKLGIDSGDFSKYVKKAESLVMDQQFTFIKESK